MSKHDNRETFAAAVDAVGDPRHLQPEIAPAPPGSGALAVRPGDAPPPAPALDSNDDDVDAEPSLTPWIDDHGFDPDDYDWVPVRRRPRKDGWSDARQRGFIEQLADTGDVQAAARAVGMSAQSAYGLRRAPGGEAFAAAWDAARAQAANRLVDLAFERAINGSDEPVFDREGRRVGRRMKPSDRMLMFLLRAYMPDRFRHAHESVRHPWERAAPSSPPLAEAIAALAPPVPADPHKRLEPGDLDAAIAVADLGDGKLPPWFRAGPAPDPKLPAGAPEWAEASGDDDPEDEDWIEESWEAWDD